LSAILCICYVQGENVQSIPSVGMVIALEGQATAVSPNGSVRSLELKSPIFMGDKIRTLENGKIQVVFKDNSLISQGANSELTIDEYVYNPKEKEENKASLGIMKGVFRMVTGKITKLNPEKFETRTKMATIGIRGCDLGFRVEGNKENIYVIELHGEEEVNIRGNYNEGKDDQGKHLGQLKDHEDQGKHLGQLKDREGKDEGGGWEKNVNNGGKAFIIDEDGNVDERDMTEEELGQLVNDVTPDNGLDSDGKDIGESDTEGTTETGETEGSTATSDTGTDTATSEGTTEGNDVIGGEELTTDIGDDSDVGAPELQGDAGIADQTTFSVGDTTIDNTYIPPPPPPPSSDELAQTPPPEELPPSEPPDSGEEEPPPEEGDNEPQFVSHGSGSDYEWGTWELDGQYTGIEIFSPNNAEISASDFDTIASDPIVYSMSGSGSGGALIDYMGETRFVSGSFDLNVLIGDNNVPTWDGSASFANDQSDSLNFDASGTIQSGNEMIGNLDYYNMTVNGAVFSFGDVTDESFSGCLLGPGVGSTPPITGAKLEFFIDNNNGEAVVHGVAGSDLAN